jgi:zinc transporter 1/2/3
MLSAQGLMSAISAGLLIYAATVEMIAGDFVFGDVEGHGHHHHGGPNARPEGERGEGEGEGTIDHNYDEVGGHGHNGHGPSSMGKKALTVVSLLAGALGMALVGLGE